MKNLIIILFTATLLFSCSNKEKEFDESLQASYKEMKYIIEKGGEMVATNAYCWYQLNTIGKSEEYVALFLKQEWEKKEYIDSLNFHKKLFSVYTSKLDNKLESRKECFTDYMRLFEKTIELARQAENIGGPMHYYIQTSSDNLTSLKDGVEVFEKKYKDLLE